MYSVRIELTFINPRTRVAPGTDGGISVIGSVAAVLSALSMSRISLAVFVIVGWPDDFEWKQAGNFDFLLLLLPAGLGFVGCQLDSILGATAEKRGWLGNGGVNFVAIGISAVISYNYWIFYGIEPFFLTKSVNFLYSVLE